MSMTIEQNLVPAAIVEFKTAIDAGKSEGEAWQVAVDRVRYDVLRMAILACEIRGQSYEASSIEAAVCHDCAQELRERL